MASTILGSRYELIERVGMGGMAIVYKAKDQILNRYVAIKILREEFKENEDFIRRFKVESQAAASLSHQNIAQIYDVGEERGMNYIVMEFLEGETLKKYIMNKQGNLTLKEAMNFSMQICRALEHAHSKYVVHRDIKPQNIVITENGKLKLADFGIARAANNTTTVNSKSNMAVGSAHYLSPEQARGGYTDHRSDIYSLGIVMYEMFCGKLPFDAEESVSVLMQHLHEEPVAPREVNPSIPEGIEAIIMKAMCKEQRLRYESASQILDDLIRVYQNPSISAAKLHASSGAEEEKPEKKEVVNRAPRTPKSRRDEKPPQRKGLLIALIAVLLFFALAIFAAVGLFDKLMNPDTGEEVEIPYLVGMSFEDALKKAEEASTDKVKFNVFEGDFEFNDAPKGTVIKQDPQHGGKVKKSRNITVDISKGPVAVTLDDYFHKDIDSVKEQLESKGIIVKIEYVIRDKSEVGKIVDQNPMEGTQLGEGEVVTFKIGKEGKSTYAPNLVGKTEKDAIAMCEDRNLLWQIVEDDSSDLPAGTVVSQFPEAGDEIAEGETITLTVSTGKASDEPEEPEKPDTPEEPEKPEEPETPPPVQKQTVTVTLMNLAKDKSVRVRVSGNGVTVFEKDIASPSGSATISFEGEKGTSYDIYYDGTWIREVTS